MVREPINPIVHQFNPGETVRLRADHRRAGAVIEGPRMHATGTEYRIFFSAGDIQWLSSNLLEPSPQASGATVKPISGETLLRDIALAKLLNPLNDGLYAYGASRTDFAVYQFRPVLKFLRNWMNGTPGLLIADEVGLGKTIEAAIILQELKARIDVQRAVVLCPSRLTGKWQDELSTRFGEHFRVLDATSARQLLQDVHRYGAGTRFRIIASFEMLRRAEFLEQLATANVPIDYLVIDEAHHLRNTDTRTHQLGETLADNADAIVLLSATPMHLGSQDLFSLLKLVAPQEFGELVFFDTMLTPNRFLNEAGRAVVQGNAPLALQRLRRVESTDLRQRFLRDPHYQAVVAQLQRHKTDLPLADRVTIQNTLNDLNTLSSVLTRTRKREFAQAALRDPRSVMIQLTPVERSFYNEVLRQTRLRLQSTGRDARGFATIMLERQAASCLPAMRDKLAAGVKTPTSNILLGHEQSSFDLSFESYEIPDDDAVVTDGLNPSQRKNLLELARGFGHHDSKYEQLRHILQSVLQENVQRKVLLFSYFRQTIDYLSQRLRADGVSVGVLHGGIKQFARRELIERFQTGDDIRVLLSSEVGAEGLDFQFCDVLVNCDLPWNPMQVEQRIGRLDRFGQRAPKIRIYNFFLDDTIETRIFQRLYDRIEIFQHSVGDLEEILGGAIRDLRMEVLRPNLTVAQERHLAEQTELRIERERQEQERFASEEQELLGQGNLLDQRVDAAIESGRVIVPQELGAIVATFMMSEFPQSTYESDDEEPCATLKFDEAIGTRLDRYLQERRMPHDSPLVRARAERSRISLTFSSDQARERPSQEFVTIHHPLAQMAIDHWRDAALMRGAADPHPALLSIEGPIEEAGPAWFFLFGVSVKAVSNKESIEVVVLRQKDGAQLPNTQRHFLHHVQQQATASSADDVVDLDAFAHWHRRASQIMATRRDEIERTERLDNTARIESRRAALEASVIAKTKRLQERAMKADDDRILRMTNSQIRNVRARMEQDLQQLERSREVVVSSRLIAGGQVFICADPDPMTEESLDLQDVVQPESLEKDMTTEWRSLLRGWVRR